MSNYTTIVIRMPDNDPDKATVRDCLKRLEPFQTAMSIEDEMTILEMIEQHDDFPEYIADEAREKTKELHTQADKTKLMPHIIPIQSTTRNDAITFEI